MRVHYCLSIGLFEFRNVIGFDVLELHGQHTRLCPPTAFSEFHFADRGFKCCRSCVLGAVSLAVTPAVAQTDNPPSTTPAVDGDVTVRPDLAFDVVSIHPSNTGPERDQVQVRVVGDEYQATQMPLGNTILMAYFPFRMGTAERHDCARKHPDRIQMRALPSAPEISRAFLLTLTNMDVSYADTSPFSSSFRFAGDTPGKDKRR